MPNNHLPTQTAVIKALTKLFGDDQTVFPAHKISSAPGFYVGQPLKHVSGPTIFVVSSDVTRVTGLLADVLIGKGFEIVRSGVRLNQITVNFIPREAR